jgi:hypothetical protein
VNRIFDACTPSTQSHAGAWKFALIAKFGGWQPHRGKSAKTQESGQAAGVEFVSFVYVAHKKFSFAGVGEERQASCGFDLVGYPVAIADALQSERRGSDRCAGDEERG